MSVFDDVFDDNYPSQILVDEVFDAEHNAGLFDQISVLHQAIMDQNWKAADAQIQHIENFMDEPDHHCENDIADYYGELKYDAMVEAQLFA